ncbi:type II secretion system F family protein [Bacterioplanoides sp.]|uniref:type II secretion system F family protein n=2 Tax=Bacterioplanoides sp. TaxID=2066072 RepID=UPI003B008860
MMSEIQKLEGIAGLSVAQWQLVLLLLLVLVVAILLLFFTLQANGTQQQELVQKRFRQRCEVYKRHSLELPTTRSWADYLNWLPVTEKDQRELGALLAQAGFRQPHGVLLLVGIKLAALLLLPLLVWLLASGPFTLGLLAKLTLAALLGSLAPEWWLQRRARFNQEQVRTAVPDAVDLMVICAESGLHIDAILQQVASDIRDWSPILADEMLYTHADIQMGKERYQALRGLSQRTQVTELDHLVSALIQADQYGTPLVKALRDLAQESRRLHLLNVEERIGKIPATISLPLMLFVLIPLVVMLAGPSMVMLVRSLGEL